MYLFNYFDPYLSRSRIHKSRINYEHKSIEDTDLASAQKYAAMI